MVGLRAVVEGRCSAGYGLGRLPLVRRVSVVFV